MPQPPPLATAVELEAPPAWRSIDFISDLHLEADMPRTFAAFAAYLRDTPADALLILGDLFEVWVGDDARDAGFELHCMQMLARAAKRHAIGFMVGNRDFLAGSDLLRDCGMFGLSDPTLLIAFGERALLTHGDALCLSDVAYQGFRAEVRSAAWQDDFLARPLPERRALARGLRDASEQRKRQTPLPEWPDIDPAAALQCLADAQATLLIHGHTHRPASGPIGAGRLRHVLSDWDLDQAAPPGRAEILRWTDGGLQRLSLARAGLAA